MDVDRSTGMGKKSASLVLTSILDDLAADPLPLPSPCPPCPDRPKPDEEPEELVNRQHSTSNVWATMVCVPPSPSPGRDPRPDPRLSVSSRVPNSRDL